MNGGPFDRPACTDDGPPVRLLEHPRSNDQETAPPWAAQVTETFHEVRRLLEEALHGSGGTPPDPWPGPEAHHSPLATQTAIAKLRHQAVHGAMTVHVIQGTRLLGPVLAPLAQLQNTLVTSHNDVQLLASNEAVTEPADLDAARQLSAQGASVRVLPRPLPTAVLVDGVVAIIHVDRPVAREHLLVVRDPRLVGAVEMLYRAVWDEGIDLAEIRAVDEPWSEDSTPYKVLTLLSDGYTDAAAARKLGLSLRTYRRHVADIMRALGAKSRFQAGTLATRRLMLN